MNLSICGVNCLECPFNSICKGCIKTNGAPFGKKCFIANCCQTKNNSGCQECNKQCELKNQIIKEFNDLKIKGLENVQDLNALRGAFINMEYNLSNGEKIKLLDDNKIYYGTQLPKKGTKRCYGLAADNEYLLVCEYGINGVEPEIIVYVKR